ncbi:uncharacterized protein IWZ02DRAFT_178745 [Phyllosticta citriasiana]|uniref:uncharacterized protein n=1 Tax=Phyllosticta citriasiana TaxID=595635 RepID=UPI0030FD6D68
MDEGDLVSYHIIWLCSCSIFARLVWWINLWSCLISLIIFPSFILLLSSHIHAPRRPSPSSPLKQRNLFRTHHCFFPSSPPPTPPPPRPLLLFQIHQRPTRFRGPTGPPSSTSLVGPTHTHTHTQLPHATTAPTPRHHDPCLATQSVNESRNQADNS